MARKHLSTVNSCQWCRQPIVIEQWEENGVIHTTSYQLINEKPYHFACVEAAKKYYAIY